MSSKAPLAVLFFLRYHLPMNHWTIDESNAGERLDVFLASVITDKTRSAIQKLIQNGGVSVNKKPTTVHRFLKVGDQIDLVEIPSRPAAKSAKHLPSSPSPLTPRIISESADYLVIDKPTGLLVHPDAKTQDGTLIDWLIKHDPKIAKVGESPDRPGIVHRLDREVSGLMVVAKNQKAYDALTREFAEHKTEKTYLALVHGEIAKDEADIKFRIARSTTQPRMAAHPVKEEEGKAAWTHIRVLERFVGATLLEIKILSGRTHQIRAHLHALGHAVMGDPLYTHKKTDRNVTAPRLMLQSVGLGFTDPATGDRVHFVLEPDDAFSRLVQEFRHS